MDEKKVEAKRRFAGQKIPTMKRRDDYNDYHGRRLYMITIEVEGRRPLFGQLAGMAEAADGSPDAPRIVLSPLGRAVHDEWCNIPRYYPQIEVMALQMMPDHLHGILFVQREMDNHLGIVLKGFKTGCNKEYRKMIVGCVATVLQHTGQQQKHTGHEEGLLFERNYNDRLLLREGQLQRWIDYLDDNPRRLLAKREHPDLFRVHFGLQLAGQTYAAIGNRFLLQRPWKLQVQCSRSLTKDEIDAKVDLFLSHARQGAVLVSPAISEGEKAVMRAALEARLPLIFLSPNNITPFTKPGGAFIEACSRGDLLILAPWPDHSATQPLTRQECLTLNKMAETICEQ
jgi:hypothetical protein